MPASSTPSSTPPRMISLPGLRTYLPLRPPTSSRRRLTPLLAALASVTFLLFVLRSVDSLDRGLARWIAMPFGGNGGGGPRPGVGLVKGPADDVLHGSKLFDDAGNELWNLPDRLLPDERYLVTGHIAGWTNQVMSSVHTIHLALLTKRTPIIPFFHGYQSQLGGPLVTIPLANLAFSEIFDLPRLVAAVRATDAGRALRGVVDVREILEINRAPHNGGRGWPARVEGGGGGGGGAVREFGGGWIDGEGERWEVGCWRAYRGGLARPLDSIRIEPTFTRLPYDALPLDPRLAVQRPLWPGLKKYLDAADPDATAAVVEQALAGLNVSDKGSVRPNAWVTCVDTIYYAVSTPSQTLWQSWTTPALPLPLGPLSPLDPPVPAHVALQLSTAPDAPGPWETVGQHMHWVPELEAHAHALARRILGVQAGQAVPPFISVHIRHGDFLSRCRPTDSCFSLGAFVHAVADLRARLLAEKDVAVAHVVLATDETDPAFLAQVDALEWVRVGEDVSLEIRRSLGDWYPMLLDNVLLSLGKGFVGTADSTMSLLNGRRVEYWNDGLAAYINHHAPEA